LLWMAVVGCALIVQGPLVAQFGYSLEIATAVTLADIDAKINAAKEVTPDDAESWKQKVEQPVLTLADRKKGSVGLLSIGWGWGNALIFLIFWFGMTPACCLGGILAAALGGDPRFYTRSAFAVSGMVTMFLPLYCSYGVANVSTKCQDLLEQLNAVRINDLGQHLRLVALETALRNLNKEQGLGIVVAGILFDTNLVKKLVLFIASACTTVVPILLVNYHQVRSPPPTSGQNSTVPP
jgi:hypothetical protein